MLVWRRIGMALGAVLTAVLTYMGYVAWEGSERLVHPGRSVWCFTPATEHGWSYEAINYELADDRRLVETQPDLRNCSEQGEPPGDGVVTPDGERIAGWYIPAAEGGPSDGPTVVLVHGHGDAKSGMLKYAPLLHDRHHLLLLDLRNHGRSTGTHTTMGAREAADVQAMLDWLAAEKGVRRVVLFGSSMGGVAAANVADDDRRVIALVLDSTHARLQNTIESRLRNAGHPIAGPGWIAVWIGAWIRTGENVAAADAVDAVGRLGDRPLLVLQGGADIDQGPENAEELLEAAEEGGVEVELHTCPDATHGRVVDTCPNEYRDWLLPFLERAFED
jgi:pimeloyl-ACP methyl ester carboxylesterase